MVDTITHSITQAGQSDRTDTFRVRKERNEILGLATSGLTGCATVGFAANGSAACPQVVEYGREFQVQAAEELALLPDGPALVEMVGGHAGSGTGTYTEQIASQQKNATRHPDSP